MGSTEMDKGTNVHWKMSSIEVIYEYIDIVAMDPRIVPNCPTLNYNRPASGASP